MDSNRHPGLRLFHGALIAIWCCCAGLSAAWAQDVPHFRLTDLSSSRPLPLNEVHASVRVIGDRAVTTMDLRFSAETARRQEITFQCSLPAGAVVTRFAMDIDGALREARVVEKGPDIRKYDAMRRLILPTRDTTGARPFQARIPPADDGKDRRVIIAWEEILKYQDGDDFYRCPLNFKDEVKLFSFEAVAENQPFAPTMQQHPLGAFSFRRKGNAYHCRLEARNYVPDRPIDILLPVNPEEAQLFFEPEGDSTWFYLRDFVGGPSEEKRPVKRILLVWDASYSGLLRDHPAELAFLGSYLEYLGNATVEVAGFADRLLEKRSFEIKNGQWQTLRAYLEGMACDGASLPGQLSLSGAKCEEVLLFTDGGCSFGTANFQLPRVPVHAVVHSPLTDRGLLRELCAVSGGKFLDLTAMSPQKALDSLLEDRFRFISARFPRGKVSNLSPGSPTACPDGFVLAGVLHGRGSKLELRFGYGNRVTRKVKYTLERPESHKVTTGLKRIHTQLKIKELQCDPQRNRRAITALGIDGQAITEHTYFWMPQTVEDYADKEVPPPDDLLPEFNRLLRLKRKAEIRSELRRNTVEVDRLEEILYDYMDRIDWFEEGMAEVPNHAGWLPEERDRFRQEQDSTARTPLFLRANGDFIPGIPDAVRGIRGRVETGEGPVASALVRVKDTRLCAYTDEEGKFFILTDSIPRYAVLTTTKPGLGETALSFTDFRRDSLLHLPGTDPRNPRNGLFETASLSPYDWAHRHQMRYDSLFFQPFANYPPPPSGLMTVVNGLVTDTLPRFKTTDIVGMQTFRSDRLLFRHGQKAAQGALLIFTERFQHAERRAPLMKQLLQLPAWDSSRPYLDSLRRVPAALRYPRYLQLRDEFGGSPSFFAEVGEYFIAMGREEEGLRILSNLAEFDLRSPEALRCLAYRMQVQGRHREALPLLERVAREFPREPQSYRDLALAHARTGQEQKAVDLLNELLRHDWSEVADLFEGIEQTVLAELNALLATSHATFPTDHIDQRMVYRMPVPLRVTASWSRFETDVDLYLLTPGGDTLDFRENSAIGYAGTDMVDGYGPEEILLLVAEPGEYVLLVDHFDDSSRNEAGPTFLKIEVFQHFGEERSTVRTFGLRLEREAKKAEAARFRLK